MKTKKLLALLISVLMLVSVLSTAVFAEDETTAAEDAEAALQVQDYQTAFANICAYYPASTPVYTVDGITVTWDMFSYWLTNIIYNNYGMYIYYLGGLPTDLSADEEAIYEYAAKQCNYFVLAHARTAAEGLTLSDEQQQSIEDSFASLLESYGTEEALEEALTSSGLTKELYRSMLEYSTDMTNLKNAHVGAEGELLSDEEVVAWGEENGYIRTKHILFNYPDAPEEETDADGNVVESEEYTAALEQYELDKEAVRAKAEEVIAALTAAELEGEALEAEFDRLMNEQSEDSGLAGYPDGYTYVSGTMVSAFEDAAFALEDYAISDVVETEYGCHVLLGLPLGADMLTREQNSSTGEYMTLRQNAASSLFNDELLSLINSAEPEWKLELLSLNDYTAGNSRTVNSKLIAVIILVALAAVVTVVMVLLKKKPAAGAAKELAPAAETAAEASAETAEETVAEAVEEISAEEAPAEAAAEEAPAAAEAPAEEKAGE